MKHSLHLHLHVYRPLQVLPEGRVCLFCGKAMPPWKAPRTGGKKPKLHKKCVVPARKAGIRVNEDRTDPRDLGPDYPLLTPPAVLAEQREKVLRRARDEWHSLPGSAFRERFPAWVETQLLREYGQRPVRNPERKYWLGCLPAGLPA